jgi:hypothetical protein
MKLTFLLNICLEMMEVWMDSPWIQFFIDFDFTIIYVANNVGKSWDTKVHVMENAYKLPHVIPQSPFEENAIYWIRNYLLVGSCLLDGPCLLYIPPNSTTMPTSATYRSQPSSNQYPHVLTKKTNTSICHYKTLCTYKCFKHLVNTHNPCQHLLRTF